MAIPVSLLTHMHVCPAINPGPIPHVGGPVNNAGQFHVRVTGLPIAVVGGTTICTGVPCPDAMIMGNPNVRIMKKPVMRIGDSCSHGGKMVQGIPFVRA